MTATRARRVLLASFTTLLIVLFGLALVIGQRRAEEAARRSDETLGDVRELEAFLTAMTALENRQREYLMTGDDVFLVEYGIAHQEVETRLDSVSDILARHHGADAVDRIERLVRTRVAVLDSGLALAREVSSAAARSYVAEGDGPRIMRDIRAHLTEHEQERIDALGASRAEEQRRAGWLFGLIVGGTLLALVATVGTDISFERALRQSEESAEDLADLNAQLEEHTADLETANARLNAQAADLEAQAIELEELVETLGENEERFHALTDHAADLTFVVDRDGTLTYVSKAVERVLGHAPEQLVGTSAFEIVHPADVSIVQGALERLVREPGGIGEVEVRLAHADAGWRTVAARASSLLDVPSVAGVVVNAHDVTERRAIEAQLRQSQKMEAVGRLTAGIAHDFNNLLTAINGYSTFALTESTDEHVRQDLEEVVAAGRRASALTRQLLAFSRQQVLRPRLIEPNQVIAEMQPLIRRTLGEDVTLSTHLGEGTGPVLADPMQIEQVLLNLAVNARDAMPHGGRLSIETRPVAADAQPIRSASARGWVVITVTDTGHGMPPEVRDRVFEPFYTTKPSGQGTGLGLSTVYGIVQQSGGDINVYSEPGHGTVFKILLPIADATSEDAAAVRWRGPSDRQTQSAPLPRGDGRTVIVVEDDPAVRAFVKRGLEELGYAVLAPPEPEEAIALLRDSTVAIDLLATDVIMPRMSGSAMAEAARAQRPGLPVLFVSGYTYNQVLERGVLPPDVNFLEKPFSIEALAREIARLLQKG